MPQDDRFDQRLGEIERRLKALDERLSAVERFCGDRSASDEAALRSRIVALEAEKQKLADRLAALSADRTQARPEQVTEAFRRAVETMQSALRPRPGDRIGYAVNELEVGLKSLLALEKDGSLAFVLPTPADRFEPGQLTEVRFSLRATMAAEVEAALIAVPALLGLPRDAALEALARAGLKPGRVSERESRYPPGTVVDQAPQPGVEVAADRLVDLVVAIPLRSEVPDVIGLPIETAIARLEQAVLVLGERTERMTRDAAENTVVEQRPAAGTRVDRGSAVAVVVAKAPPATVLVPALRGQPLRAAEAALGASRLSLGKVTRQPNGRPGLVLAQEPKPGTEVAPGTAVDVVVAAEPEVDTLIARAVEAAAGTRAGISGKLLGERLRALGLKSYAEFAALANAPLEELQKKIGAPTPRGLLDAQAALRKALDGNGEGP
ncbi:PASTA domain-containing protein [Elioraea thermophila]|uniref:PASTA domain-containing protein n=1 Tax=Elioraea thermophila TaxID=2185104 RepID=UPI000DF3A820|nr:PASTA domain-containing protein [Elioraea thermophila]